MPKKVVRDFADQSEQDQILLLKKKLLAWKEYALALEAQIWTEDSADTYEDVEESMSAVQRRHEDLVALGEVDS